MLEVKNVTKNFGGLRAVDGVSFRLEKGEALGLLGPNAAGKTTLMRIMAGYLPADGGSVLLDGMDISESPIAVKRRLGYLPEIPPLYNDMTVKSYLLFASEIKGVPKQSRVSRAEEVMERTGVKDVAGRLIRNISKGYRQRVGLAQAMIHNPDVLILDEPTVGLDPHQIIEIRNLIKELSETNTILLSSHILTEVSATCDRVVILNEGRVAAVDTQEGLARRLRGGDALNVEVAGAKPGEAANAFLSIEGVEGVEQAAEAAPGSERFTVSCRAGFDARGPVFHKAASSGWTLLELSRDSISLEDVFIKLTADEEAGSDE
jgi:ABC-2 type transport system ATP-binding protein